MDETKLKNVSVMLISNDHPPAVHFYCDVLGLFELDVDEPRSAREQAARGLIPLHCQWHPLTVGLVPPQQPDASRVIGRQAGDRPLLRLPVPAAVLAEVRASAAAAGALVRESRNGLACRDPFGNVIEVCEASSEFGPGGDAASRTVLAQDVGKAEDFYARTTGLFEPAPPPAGPSRARLLYRHARFAIEIAKPESPAEQGLVGQQACGTVLLSLPVPDYEAARARLGQVGVALIDEKEVPWVSFGTIVDPMENRLHVGNYFDFSE